MRSYQRTQRKPVQFINHDAVFHDAQLEHAMLSWRVRVVKRVWLSAWLTLGAGFFALYYVIVGCLSLRALGRQLIHVGLKLQKYGY